MKAVLVQCSSQNVWGQTRFQRARSRAIDPLGTQAVRLQCRCELLGLGHFLGIQGGVDPKGTAAIVLAAPENKDAVIGIGDQVSHDPGLRPDQQSDQHGGIADREVGVPDDAAEGAVAFAEKRSPIWKGRTSSAPCA